MLTAEVSDLAGFLQFVTVAQLDAFFGGNSDEIHAAGQFVHHGLETHGHGGHHGGLYVVAAGVHGAGLRVTVGVGDTQHGVQFAHDGNLGAGPGAGRAATAAGVGDAAFNFIAFLFQRICQQFGGLEFTVAGFGVFVDLVGNGQNIFPAGVDGGNDRLFHLLLIHTKHSS